MRWGSFDNDVVQRYGSGRWAWVSAGIFGFGAMATAASLVASGGDWKVWASLVVFTGMALFNLAIALRLRVLNDILEDTRHS